MGTRWLHDCIGTIQRYGVELDFYPGYETRSRSTGGFTDIRGINTHHDAVPVATSTVNRQLYAWITAATRPIGNFYLKKDGRVTFGAAGASNTSGASEQIHQTSRGPIPISRGNEYLVSIEAENNGVWEAWTPDQMDAYVDLCAALCEHYDLDPITDIFTHHRYTKRKIDPAGPTPGRDWGSGSWPDFKFNQDVLKRMEGNTMRAVNPERLFEGAVKAGQQVLIPCRYSGSVMINVTVDQGTKGWVSPAANPGTSIVNFIPNQPNSGAWLIPSLGGFYLKAVDGGGRVMVDVCGAS